MCKIVSFPELSLFYPTCVGIRTHDLSLNRECPDTATSLTNTILVQMLPRYVLSMASPSNRSYICYQIIYYCLSNARQQFSVVWAGALI